MAVLGSATGCRQPAQVHASCRRQRVKLMGILPRKRFPKPMGGSNRTVFRMCMETKVVVGESRGWSCGGGSRGCSA